jgi:hypothetical protein
MKLTKPIERLAVPPGKSEAIFFDDDVPGFGLRLRAGGSRTFIVQYALGGRQRRMTIGAAKVLDAPKARQTARNLLAKVRLGHDPAADRAEARVRASDELLGDVVGRLCGRLRVGKAFFTFAGWSVQPCVRPVSAAHKAAGHNALRGSGPGQNLAFDNALAQMGCPDRRIDRLCITCCSPFQPSHHAGCRRDSGHAASATGSL